MSLTTRNARALVQVRKNFKAANIFGQNWGPLYVVYSYGTHWPLYIYDSLSDKWFENEDRYSTTTSKHRTLTRPNAKTLLRSCSWMKACIEAGGADLLEEQRLLASLPLS